MKFKDFLTTKHLTMEQFQKLEKWKQDTYREQHQEANRLEQIENSRPKKNKSQIEYEDAIDVLRNCGVPFGDDDSPLGIGS